MTAAFAAASLCRSGSRSVAGVQVTWPIVGPVHCCRDADPRLAGVKLSGALHIDVGRFAARQRKTRLAGRTLSPERSFVLACGRGVVPPVRGKTDDRLKRPAQRASPLTTQPLYGW
jgi:hypothetical protein